VSVRRILAGTDDGSSSVNRAIERPPGAPGWFAPDSAVWQVHGSVSTFLGGIRALLLQALHPVALAGVNAHSSYRDDPYGRLQRTGAFIAATTFGSAALADQTCAAVTRIHRGVHGTATAADGTTRRFAATDQDLLAWIHLALVDSMLDAGLRFGTGAPLDADRYVAEMAVIGRAMGVVEPPTTHAALHAAIDDVRPSLAGGPALQEIRGFVLAPPMAPATRLGYTVLARAAEDSLPAWARDLLGTPPRSEAVRRADAAAARVLLETLRVALVESPSRAAAEHRLGLRA
jgi:uncharacterized protein (DUF2236 family)